MLVTFATFGNCIATNKYFNEGKEHIFLFRGPTFIFKGLHIVMLQGPTRYLSDKKVQSE